MKTFNPEECIFQDGKAIPLGDILWSGVRAFKSGRYDEALADLKLSAEKNSVDAARLLARMHYAGHGVAKNHDAYVYWLSRAAELGDLASRAKLKRLIKQHGVPESLKQDEYIVRKIKRQ